MKNFISLKDLPNFGECIKQAMEFKKNPFSYKHIGEGKTIGMLFFNPSLRTRLSTQLAAQNL